jgi:replicative DNA helicase
MIREQRKGKKLTEGPEQPAPPFQHDITRHLPFSNDAEKGVLSCFLHNPTDLLADAQNTIPEEAFYHPGNRLLYETMVEFHEGGERPVEYIALSQHLQDKGKMDKIGGQGALAELLDFVPTPAHYGYYKGILLDKFLLRRIIGGCTDSINNAYEYQEDVPALLERVNDRFYELTKQQQGKGHRTWKQIMATYMDTLEARAKGERETGIPTRWPAWNQTWGGITPTLWLITAYPSDGKSTLKQNLIEDTLAHGKAVLDFSFEMDETELADRYMTAMSQLDSSRIFFPQNGIDRDDWRAISNSISKMQEWPLYLRTEDWTFEQCMAECRAMARKDPNLGLITFDYLQLMTCAKEFDKRSSEISYISRSLKKLNKTLGIPIVVLSQLNDDGKTLESRAPTQDASNIGYIDPGSVEFKHGKRIEHPAGLRVVKNRNGKKNHLLPIKLNGAAFTFEEEWSEDAGPQLPVSSPPPPAVGTEWN